MLARVLAGKTAELGEPARAAPDDLRAAEQAPTAHDNDGAQGHTERGEVARTQA